MHRLALVGESPIKFNLYDVLNAKTRGKLLLGDSTGSLVNNKGFKIKPSNNVLYLIIHDATMKPTMNKWFTNVLSNSQKRDNAIGVITAPLHLTHNQRNTMMEMLYYERHCISFGYHLVTYDNLTANTIDINLLLQTIDYHIK